jgi:hypothetical protein
MPATTHTQTQKHYTIALLSGDSLGPQLSTYATRILTQIAQTRPRLSFTITSDPFGGGALSTGHESSLPSSTLSDARESSAVLLCGCGDAKYGREPEKGLLRLREELGVYANIRPVAFPSTRLAEECSSFKAEKVHGLDVTFVRDLTGGCLLWSPTGGRQQWWWGSIRYDGVYTLANSAPRAMGRSLRDFLHTTETRPLGRQVECHGDIATVEGYSERGIRGRVPGRPTAACPR